MHHRVSFNTAGETSSPVLYHHYSTAGDRDLSVITPTESGASKGLWVWAGGALMHQSSTSVGRSRGRDTPRAVGHQGEATPAAHTLLSLGQCQAFCSFPGHGREMAHVEIHIIFNR